MFSLIDIADMHSEQRHKSLYDRCNVSTCETDGTFKEMYGAVPAEQCEFFEAYNEIISSKGEAIRTYVIDTTLWAFEEGYYLNRAASINLLLMMYVLSKHCSGRYEDITAVGYWNREYGNIILMPISEISEVTLNSIAYDYIGYAKGSGSWETAEGTNNSILYEAVSYFKHSRKYRDVLSNFKYAEAPRKLMAKFEERTSYPIVQDANNYLSAPIKYGGSEPEKIVVNYISDIHVGHHINPAKPVLSQIRKMVRELSESQQRGLVFFVGDTAVDRNLCALFYKEYMLRRQYLCYKEWKQRNKYKPALSRQEAIGEYEKQLYNLWQQKDEEIRRIKPWFKYTKKFGEKDLYEMDQYISSAYFTRKHYPDFIALRLKNIKRIEQKIYDFFANRENIVENLQKEQGEKRYQKVIIENVFAVLGNHEMADFDTIEEATSFYSQLFRRLGIHFLNNSVLSNERLIILGGCGFAKYNPEFNATNTLNAKVFTREDEIKETDSFERVYREALDRAKAERKPLIVLAHYPTKDWLKNDQCDSQAVYFTGHTHRNTSEGTEQRNIYADNQVGYKRKSVLFKTAKLGTVQNPFNDFEDGCYEITTEQYCDYYRYSGNPLSGVSVVNNVLRKGGRFFMIKHSGFYGFFTQNMSMEISICVGGKTRRIPEVKSIDYLMKNFDAMVSVYLKAMLPFRRAQEQISSEIQALGFSGRIHGCIVDVNYYNHVMLNPLDGTITYYYSPVFGTLQPYKTFAKLLEHIGSNYLIEEQDVQDKYSLMVTSGCLLSQDSFSTSAEVGELVTIDIKGSIYELSARINQLQRLFTSRVLRDWNPAFIDKQSAEQDWIANNSMERSALN